MLGPIVDALMSGLGRSQLPNTVPCDRKRTHKTYA